MNMDDKPRYSRVTDIIELIILMQSKVAGVSLNDIQEEFNVSRRTAESPAHKPTRRLST